MQAVSPTPTGEYMGPNGDSPLFPTNFGWLMQSESTILQSPALDLDNSKAFTIEFEVFPFHDPQITIYLHPNISEFENNIGGYTRYGISSSNTRSVNPSNFQSNFKLNAFEHAIVYLSLVLDRENQ